MTMKPGRELDTMVAEVMGIPIYDFDQHRGNYDWLNDEANYPCIAESAELILWTEPQKDGQPWNPSEDIYTAMMAWEWLEENNPWPRISLQRDEDNKPTVYKHIFGDHRVRVTTGESYPHAIALAVLAADKDASKRPTAPASLKPESPE